MWRELEKCTFNPEQMQGVREAFHCPLCHEMLIPGKPHSSEARSDFEMPVLKRKPKSKKEPVTKKYTILHCNK